VAKSAWGRKRTCTSCGALFYDMKKNPAICPKCGIEDSLQPLLKPRRTPAAKPAPAKPAAVNDDAEDTDVPDDIEDIEVDDDEDEEHDLLVDDDLDDDSGDDVSAVKGHMAPAGDKD